MDRTGFESDLRRDGFAEVFEGSMPADTRRPTHVHPWDVRGLVLTGVFLLGCEGDDRRYGPGEIFTLARDVPHTEGAGPDGTTYVVGRRRA